MKSYKELQAEIKTLQEQAEKARQMELANAIAEIKAKMQEYGITVDDLTEPRTKSAKRTQSVEPKYRDPASGEVWSGRGKAPKWIAGKDRNAFLIKKNA